METIKGARLTIIFLVASIATLVFAVRPAGAYVDCSVSDGWEICDNNPSIVADCDNDGFSDYYECVGIITNPDKDGDYWPDIFDYCPKVTSAQIDSNQNGIGDECELATGEDLDGDGIYNEVDNCPHEHNLSQSDADNDGIGDVCDQLPNNNTASIDYPGFQPGSTYLDPTRTDLFVILVRATSDVDGDGMNDNVDNCPVDFNPAQVDVNHNGVGDVCELTYSEDIDGDGFLNDEDNCVAIPNNQLDSDSDGLGDACDESLIPADPLVLVSQLGVTVHEISPLPDGSRKVALSSSLNSWQSAVRITESLSPETPDDNDLGTASYGTPNNYDGAVIFSERIRNFIETECAGASQCKEYYSGTDCLADIQACIDLMARDTTAHELGHMAKLTAESNDRFGGNHYKAGSGTIMEDFIKFTTKGGKVTFYIPTGYAEPDPVDAQISGY